VLGDDGILADMRIRFGSFELDDERFLLTRGDRRIPLRPKAFDLLVTLVRERGRVVRREELFADLWSTTAVGPGSLSGLVNELRCALGESGRGPSSIRTVHARGYQFVATIDACDACDEDATAAGAARADAVAAPDAPDVEVDAGGDGAGESDALGSGDAEWIGILRDGLAAVRESGARALVASNPDRAARAAWLARASAEARRIGFEPRWPAGAAPGGVEDSGGTAGDATRPSRPDAAPAGETSISTSGRAPVALCLDVEEPRRWAQAGGLPRLLDLLVGRPVLVIAALAGDARAGAADPPEAGDGRIARVEPWAGAVAADAGRAIARDEVDGPVALARTLRSLARVDRTGFEAALAAMGFVTAASRPIRALRRVEPDDRARAERVEAEVG